VQEWIGQARENIDVEEWSRRFGNILRGLDELSNSEDLRRSLAGIRAIMDSDETRGLATSVAAALEDVRIAAADASEMFRALDTGVGTLVEDVGPVITQLNTTLREAEQALAAARGQLRGESEQVMQLQATLHEIERATRAMREFFDYLERNPESLLKGRQQ
jgi:paraquat-inducible protein B